MDRHPSIPPMHPGEILSQDIIPALGVPKTEVARSMGISRQALYDILGQKQSVTAEMAVRLGKLLGNGAEFWINMQRAYDLHHARQSVDVSDIPTLQAA